MLLTLTDGRRPRNGWILRAGWTPFDGGGGGKEEKEKRECEAQIGTGGRKGKSRIAKSNDLKIKLTKNLSFLIGPQLSTPRFTPRKSNAII